MSTMSVPYDLLHDPNLQPPVGIHPIQTKEEELLQLLTQTEHGRQSLIDGLWARIPAYVFEMAYQPSATSVTCSPQTRNMERITGILAVVPSGSTGTVILGQAIIPVVSGLNNLTGIGFLLNASDVRNLTITQAGTLALYLFGEQLPLYGKIR
jgi:hypothetical protein